MFVVCISFLIAVDFQDGEVVLLAEVKRHKLLSLVDFFATDLGAKIAVHQGLVDLRQVQRFREKDGYAASHCQRCEIDDPLFR